MENPAEETSPETDVKTAKPAEAGAGLGAIAAVELEEAIKADKEAAAQEEAAKRRQNLLRRRSLLKQNRRLRLTSRRKRLRVLLPWQVRQWVPQQALLPVLKLVQQAQKSLKQQL